VDAARAFDADARRFGKKVNFENGADFLTDYEETVVNQVDASDKDGTDKTVQSKAGGGTNKQTAVAGTNRTWALKRPGAILDDIADSSSGAPRQSSNNGAAAGSPLRKHTYATYDERVLGCPYGNESDASSTAATAVVSQKRKYTDTTPVVAQKRKYADAIPQLLAGTQLLTPPSARIAGPFAHERFPCICGGEFDVAFHRNLHFAQCNAAAIVRGLSTPTGINQVHVAQLHKDTDEVLAVYASVEEAERSQDSNLRNRSLHVQRLLNDRAEGKGKQRKISGGYGWYYHPGPTTARVPGPMMPEPEVQPAAGTDTLLVAAAAAAAQMLLPASKPERQPSATTMDENEEDLANATVGGVAPEVEASEAVSVVAGAQAEVDANADQADLILNTHLEYPPPRVAFSGDLKWYHCPADGCINSSTRPADYRKHYRGVHLERRSFACRVDECGKTFKDSSTRCKHERSHSDATFECPASDCERSYSRKDNLAVHIRAKHPIKCGKAAAAEPFRALAFKIMEDRFGAPDQDSLDASTLVGAVNSMPLLPFAGADLTSRPHTVMPDSKAMLQSLFPEVAELDAREDPRSAAAKVLGSMMPVRDDHPYTPPAILEAEVVSIAGVAATGASSVPVPAMAVQTDHDAEADAAKLLALAGQMMPSFSQPILETDGLEPAPNSKQD
jgi:hypothetical protein